MSRVSTPRLSTAELLERIGEQTVASVFVERVRTSGDRIALRWREGDTWASMSYRAYGDAAARATAGLCRLGVERGDRIVLMMRNIPEFHVLDTACVLAGAVPISIYNSSAPEQVAYLAGHSRARFAIVGDSELAERFARVRSELPELRAVAGVHDAGEISYGELLDNEPVDLDAAAESVKPDDVITIIYTSGTTGPPKGVVITHRQVRFTAESLQIAFGLPPHELEGKRVVSYLPMAHIAERMSSHYNALLAGYEVTTCPDLGLVASYFRDVHPQIAFGVPRVWEKIRAGVLARLAEDPEKAQHFDEAVAAATPIALAQAWGTETPEQAETWKFLDEVAFAAVRKAIGFDELDVAVSAAAPITPEVLTWFRAIGVPLSELYGLSECCGPMTWEPRRVKPGMVGRPIPGVELKLADDGEVLCRGGNVFSGYLDDPARTAEVLDDDGWLHSGDIGVLDEDGYLRIVDRKKEMIITAGGKNVSPTNLEARLKLVPLVGQACAVGDNRPYVAALLVLDPEEARAFARAENLGTEDLHDLARHPRVLEVIQAGVDEAMAHFSQAERVKRFVVLADEWVTDSEELTPTSKLKRRKIAQKYAAEIESMYQM